jgi:nicotinamide mononucleotide adenylyltransferase
MQPCGSMHGRFQPFHNAHLVYALAAFQRVDHLYVGLTRVLTEDAVGRDVAPHRFQENENPLSFYQRAKLISHILVRAGVPLDRFTVGPFPIEVPDRLPEFWPITGKCFTTDVAEWNAKKIEILRAHKYDVEILGLELAGVRVASGTEIRRLFRAKDQAWREYVPLACAELIVAKGWIL